VFNRRKSESELRPARAASLPIAEALLTLIFIACAGGLAFNREFYVSSLVSAFFAMTLAGSFIIHLKVRPVWSDAGIVLGCAAFLWIVDIRILKFPPAIVVPFSFIGLSSLLVLGVRMVWAPEPDRTRLLYAFVPAVLFVSSEWMAATFLALTNAAHPRALDQFLYSFDCSLRVQLSFLMGAAFKRWIWFKFLGALFYVALAIPIAVVYGGQLVRKGTRAWPAALAFLLTGPLGIIFYNIFPASGPAHLFLANFPFHPLPVADVARYVPAPVAVIGPRNAIPSLHMTWVLLAWWYCRGLSWWSRGIALAFVIFTVVGTLGTGEHYFIDLVVAFPFALMIRSLFTFSLPWTNRRRIQDLAGGILVTFAWLAALRFGVKLFWISPIIPWALITATVVVCSLRIHQLEFADDNAQPAAIRHAETYAPVPVGASHAMD
jgi:hypothetical protein